MWSDGTPAVAVSDSPGSSFYMLVVLKKNVIDFGGESHLWELLLVSAYLLHH